MRKKSNEKYYRLKVDSAFYMLIYFIFDNLRVIFWYFFKKNEFNSYMKYRDDLKNIKSKQKLYIKKTKEKVYGWTFENKDYSEVPEVYYHFEQKTLKLRIRLNFKVTENDYEKFLENIIITSVSSLKLVEKDFVDGYFEVELGMLKDNIPSKIFVSDDDKYLIPIASSFGKVINWDIRKYPHALICGSTGSGKTSFIKYLLSSLLRYYEVSCIDGKSIDYIKYSEYFHVYESILNVDNCLKLINDFHDEMYERFSHLQSLKEDNIYDKDIYKPKFLLIDEYTSFVESLDKKQKEDINKKIGNIARLGRAVGMILISVMQRPDTNYIAGETRNNFTMKMCLAGNSSDTYRMMFNTVEGFESKPIGQGYCQIGNKNHIISIPYLKLIELEEKKQ